MESVKFDIDVENSMELGSIPLDEHDCVDDISARVDAVRNVGDAVDKNSKNDDIRKDSNEGKTDGICASGRRIDCGVERVTGSEIGNLADDGRPSVIVVNPNIGISGVSLGVFSRLSCAYALILMYDYYILYYIVLYIILYVEC